MKRSKRASNFAFANASTNGSTSVLVLALALGLTLAIAIVIAAIISTNLNMALMSPLTISDPLRPAEVIAVLSGGYNSGGSLGSATVERMDRGIELYRRGHAPVMILSGGDKPPSAARRASWMLRDQGLEVISAPAVRSEAYSAVGRQRLRIFRLIALEYLKLARYLIFRT